MRLATTAIWALLALHAPAYAAAPVRVTERRVDLAPAPRGDALLRASMLDAHNRARTAAGAAPLAWNDALAADAARYAADMARTQLFAHSPNPRGDPQQGENLWTGTRGAYRYDEMIGGWTGERSLFRNGPTPDFAINGRWEDVAHYTQMIWSTTREVGCAVASDTRDDYLVCRYLPAGNVVGEAPLP